MDLQLQVTYPHIRGYTRTAYSDCGRYLFTTGVNSLVRRFTVGSSTEPDAIDIDDQGLSLSTHKDVFCVSSKSGNVQIFDLTGSQPRATALRSAMPIRSLSLNDDATFLAMAGEDNLSIVHTNDITRQISLPGLEGPGVSPNAKHTKHICFGKGNRLAVSCLDGNVRVFDLTETRATPVTTLEGIVPYISDISDPRSTSAAFSPNGEYMALPSKRHDIVIFDTHKWLEVTRFPCEGSALDFAWSPNGAYMAVAVKDMEVFIYAFKEKKIIARWDAKDACCVGWHPTSNLLSFTSLQGQLYTVTDAVPKEYAGPSEQMSLDLNPDIEETEIYELPDDSVALSSESEIFERPSRRKRAKVQSKPRKETALLPFQSGATPWTNGKRYLCMNTVGYVWTTLQDDTHNTVTISFFDQSQHRDVHFSDVNMFDLASLSTHAVFLANSKTGKAVLRLHGQFNDEWEYTCEGIRCVCLSEEVAVICTENGYVRTFSLYGTPLQVTLLSRDPVVSCAAYGDVLFILRAGLGGPSYRIEDVRTERVYAENGCLELGPDVQPQSIIFTETGDPCIYDSRGTLCMLVLWRQPSQAKWMPVFEQTQDTDKRERYWPLGFNGSILVCCVLRGQALYPPLPLPVTSEIELRVPGVEEGESAYLLQKIQVMLHQDAGASPEVLDQQRLLLDQHILRQVHAACLEAKTNKVLELAGLLEREEALEAAAKIALHFELSEVAVRIRGPEI